MLTDPFFVCSGLRSRTTESSFVWQWVFNFLCSGFPIFDVIDPPVENFIVIWISITLVRKVRRWRNREKYRYVRRVDNLFIYASAWWSNIPSHKAIIGVKDARLASVTVFLSWSSFFFPELYQIRTGGLWLSTKERQHLQCKYQTTLLFETPIAKSPHAPLNSQCIFTSWIRFCN